MGTTIAISNHKGGVAKTTTCLSLGACFAQLGYKTLIIDLDPQADLTLSVGLDEEALETTVADWLNPAGPQPSGALPNAAICSTPVAGLDILPADSRLAGVERHLYNVKNYEAHLRRWTAGWQTTYRYILIDCPPSLGAFTLMALTAAHHVIIPVQAEFFAARRLDRLVDVVSAVKQRTNPGLRWHLLVTMFDTRNRICRGVQNQLQINFGQNLLQTVIGVDTRLRESPAVGEPITVYAPRTRASRQYRNLAQELHQLIKSDKETL